MAFDYNSMLKSYNLLNQRQQRDLYRFFCLLPEPEQNFAKRKYIDGATYEQIAEEMGYCSRNVYRLRRKVLEKLGVYLQNRESRTSPQTMRETG